MTTLIDIYININDEDIIELFNDIVIEALTRLEDIDMLTLKHYDEYATAYNMEIEKITLADICPICMREPDEIVSDNDPLFKTNCGHIFCGSCFANLIISDCTDCPMCRTEIDPRMCKFNISTEYQCLHE